MKWILYLLFVLVFWSPSGFGAYDPCRFLKGVTACGSFSGKSKGQRSYPSGNSSYNFNPASIGIKKGVGVELLVFREEVDYGLVTGTGKVGAAVSPETPEGRFFGIRAFESDEDYQERVVLKKTYESQKYSLGLSAQVVGKRKSGSKRDTFTMNVGLLGKYHKNVKKVRPGLGVVMELGPIYLGGAAYQDDNYNVDNNSTDQYTGYTASTGLNFLFLAMDLGYSKVPHAETVLWSNSLLIWKFILTYARRSEISDRPYYNFNTRKFSSRNKKEDEFYGVQVLLGDHVTVGWYRNYHLLEGDTYSLQLKF
jgi:hypothetical protein